MTEWLHLLVRGVHVLGMALLVGGAAFTWGWLRFGHGDRDAGTEPSAVEVAAGYEWLFWGAAGVVVATGVGNLGALAPAVPRPDTPWGVALLTKLGAVLGLLLGSVVRTLSVAQWDGDGVRRLRRSYAATALYLCAVLALAEVLAHG